tara:strand:+ start:45 stop:611 length:567 start_codon:yes stop_codon:yes gene_type:complete
MSLLNVNKIAPSTGTDVALGDASDTFTVAASATLQADTIAETTAANGVTIDGVSLKDSVLNTADCVTFASLSTSATETINVKNRVGKVWVNFDGTGTIAIRDDFNVASLTDNGTGDYTVTYSANLGNDDYAVVAQTGRDESGSGGHNRLHAPCIDRYAIGSHRILCIDSDNDSARDMDSVFSIVLGDS